MIAWIVAIALTTLTLAASSGYASTDSIKSPTLTSSLFAVSILFSADSFGIGKVAKPRVLLIDLDVAFVFSLHPNAFIMAMILLVVSLFLNSIELFRDWLFD